MSYTISAIKISYLKAWNMLVLPKYLTETNCLNQVLSKPL